MRRSHLAVALAALAALTASVATAAVVSISGTVDPVRVPAQRAEVPRVSLMIGDSAFASLRWVPGADNAVVGFEHVLDLESCRRLLSTSCRGREGRIPPTAYETLRAYGPGHAKVLIIATGYNDGTSNYGTAFRTIVAEARQLGYEQIVWWTLRADVDYVSPGSLGNHQTYKINNQTIRNLLATGAYPDVVLADWGAYSAGRVEWFTTDGVHHRAVGAWVAADYLSRKMAFLDGRACPFPTTPGAVPQNPCPDPDVTGPIADVEALYPIGTDGVLCYEIGDARRVECRYDTHVLQLTRTLQFGDEGRDVEAVQIRLGRLGHPVGSTGYFGTSTETAVRAFQRSVALYPSGRADRATLAALGFDVSAVLTP